MALMHRATSNNANGNRSIPLNRDLLPPYHAIVGHHGRTDKATLKGHRPGQAVDLQSIQPGPKSVDGDQLLTGLVATFDRYVFLPMHASVALALAVVMSHTHDLQTISPVVAAISPEPE